MENQPVLVQYQKSSVIRQKDESQNMLQENKVHQIFWKTNISCNTRFEIRPVALLPTQCPIQ